MSNALKVAVRFSALGVCLCLFLAGCLDVEAVRVRLDLADNRGEAVYSNIVSDAKSEDLTKGDFEDLLEMAYGEQEESEAVDYVSDELYAEGGRLNGRREFSIKDLDKTLGEFGIERDPGKFFMEVTNDTEYTGGNGALVDGSSGQRVVWDDDTRVIEFTLRTDLSGKETVSLLPYWEKWRAWDSQDAPDALALLTGHLGDTIETVKKENIIDYCPEDTCYSFSAKLRSPGAFNRLSDFAYIYLFHVMDDASLKAFKASGGSKMAEIVSRNMLDCPDEGEAENARCALQNLADTYAIELKSIVYEEMEQKETPIDIDSQLHSPGA